MAEPGSTVPIGQPIAVIGEGPDSERAQPAGRRRPRSAQPTRGGLHRRLRPRAADPAPRSRPTYAPRRWRAASPASTAWTSPTIPGTGPGGRIVRADVEAAVAAPRRAAPVAPAPACTPAASCGRTNEVPLTSIRRITAQRLTESAAAPHFYLTSVVDAEPLLALRAELNDGHSPTRRRKDQRHRPAGPSLRDRAARAIPQVNSSWGGDHLVRHGRINIGVAVALDDGLIVPVIRDADRKRLLRSRPRPTRWPAGPGRQAHPGRVQPRHVHHQQPRHVRHRPFHRGHQPARGGDPRRRRGPPGARRPRRCNSSPAPP